MEEERVLDDDDDDGIDDGDVLDNEDHRHRGDDDDEFLLDEDDLTVATETSFKDEDYEFTCRREDTRRLFKSLEPETKNWVKKLGLQDAHGTGMRGLASIGGLHYVKPDSFELLFWLADFLFPGHDYHYRLFASATRPSLKVRRRLRDLKKKRRKGLGLLSVPPRLGSSYQTHHGIHHGHNA